MKAYVLIFLVAVPLLVGACAKLLGKEEVPVEQISDGPLYLALRRSGGAEKNVLVKECGIEAGVEPYGESVRCETSVPEALLYHSDLDFTVATDGTCAFVEWKPYYYRAFNFDGALPGWTDAAETECLEGAEVACYNGPATLLANFPRMRSETFETTAQKSKVFSVPNAATSKRFSNRWTCNSLPEGRRGLNGATVDEGIGDDDYVANSMQDYELVCYDKWLQRIYSIIFTLDDENTDPDGSDFGVGPTNNFANWGSASDPL